MTFARFCSLLSLPLIVPQATDAKLRTLSPKHHCAHTPAALTGSCSESDGDEDRREVQYGLLWKNFLIAAPHFNMPTIPISAMGSLVTTKSQDTHSTSHLKDGTLHRAMWAIEIFFYRPEERVPPTDPPTPLPAASGLPSRTNPA